jgi:hypothetical protein
MDGVQAKALSFRLCGDWAHTGLDCSTETGGNSRRAGQTRTLCWKVSPGMAVSAEIETDTRRIIQYFLSPIAKATSEAGRER